MNLTKEEIIEFIEKKAYSIDENNSDFHTIDWSKIPEESWAFFERFNSPKDAMTFFKTIDKSLLTQILQNYSILDMDRLWEIIENCQSTGAPRLNKYYSDNVDPIIDICDKKTNYKELKEKIRLDVLPSKDIQYLIDNDYPKDIIDNIRKYLSLTLNKSRIPNTYGKLDCFSDEFLNEKLHNVIAGMYEYSFSFLLHNDIQYIGNLKRGIDSLNESLKEECLRNAMIALKSGCPISSWNIKYFLNDEIEDVGADIFEYSPAAYISFKQAVLLGKNISKEEFISAIKKILGFGLTIDSFRTEEQVHFINSPAFDEIPNDLKDTFELDTLMKIAEEKEKSSNPDFFEILLAACKEGKNKYIEAKTLENIGKSKISGKYKEIISFSTIDVINNIEQSIENEEEKETILNNYIQFLKTKKTNDKSLEEEIGLELNIDQIKRVFGEDVIKTLGLHSLIHGNLKTAATLNDSELKKYKELIEIACVKGERIKGIDYETHKELFKDELFEQYKDILIYGRLEITSQILASDDKEIKDNYKSILQRLGSELLIKNNYEKPEDMAFAFRALKSETREKIEKRMSELGLKQVSCLENCLKRVDASFIGRIVDDDQALDNFLRTVEKSAEIGGGRISVSDVSMFSKENFEKYGNDLLLLAGEETIKKISSFPEEDIALYVNYAKRAIQDKRDTFVFFTPDMIKTLGYKYLSKLSAQDISQLSKLDDERRKDFLNRYKTIFDGVGEEIENYNSVGLFELVNNPVLLEKVQKAIERNKGESSIKNVLQLIKGGGIVYVKELKSESDIDRFISIRDSQEKNPFLEGVPISELAKPTQIINQRINPKYYLDDNNEKTRQLELLKKLSPKDTLLVTPKQLLSLENTTDIKSKVELQLSDISEMTLEQIEQLKNRYNIVKITIEDKREKNEVMKNTYPYTVEEFIATRKGMNELLDGIEPTNGDPSKEYETFLKVYKRVIEIKYDYEALMDDYSDKVSKTCRNMVGGLTKGKCVCAGYAEILRNALACVGIDSKKVLGFKSFGARGGHAWNQVKINGKWYNVDATWDSANKTDLNFCLKNDEDFIRHDMYSYRTRGQMICKGYDSISVDDEPKVTPEKIRQATSNRGIDGTEMAKSKSEIEYLYGKSKKETDKDLQGGSDEVGR